MSFDLLADGGLKKEDLAGLERSSIFVFILHSPNPIAAPLFAPCSTQRLYLHEHADFEQIGDVSPCLLCILALRTCWQRSLDHHLAFCKHAGMTAVSALPHILISCFCSDLGTSRHAGTSGWMNPWKKQAAEIRTCHSNSTDECDLPQLTDQERFSSYAL